MMDDLMIQPASEIISPPASTAPVSCRFQLMHKLVLGIRAKLDQIVHVANTKETPCTSDELGQCSKAEVPATDVDSRLFAPLTHSP